MSRTELYWFRCACGILITITPNQLMGHEAINHASCGYYAKGIVTPGVLAPEPVAADFQTKLTEIW